MTGDPLDEAVAAYEAAADARAAGRLDDALVEAERALALFSTHCPDHDPDRVNSLVLLAGVAGDLGRFAEARQPAREAYECSRRWPSGSPPGVAEIARAAAVTHADQERIAGAYDTAEQVLLTTLAEVEDEHGTDARDLVPVLNSLGVVYKYTARFAAARRSYLRAWHLEDRADDPDRMCLAALCHNLGGLAHAEGQPELGIPWAERGLVLRTQLDADESRVDDQGLAMAADLGALGALYAQADRLDEAEHAQRRAIERFAQRLGPDHYEVGVAMGNLGHVLARRGIPCAEAILRRALAIKTQTLGPRHPDVAVALANLGTLLADSGEDEGLRLLTEAEEIASETLRADDPRLHRIRELTRDAADPAR